VCPPCSTHDWAGWLAVLSLTHIACHGAAPTCNSDRRHSVLPPHVYCPRVYCCMCGSTMSYILAPSLVAPRVCTKASAIMALTYQVRCCVWGCGVCRLKAAACCRALTRLWPRVTLHFKLHTSNAMQTGGTHPGADDCHRPGPCSLRRHLGQPVTQGGGGAGRTMQRPTQLRQTLRRCVRAQRCVECMRVQPVCWRCVAQGTL
jgi:hypothetical protein